LWLLDELVGRALGSAQPDGDDATGWPPATLALALAVGLAACLLNPHHVRAFALPPELAPRSELRRDPLFASFYQSPWGALYAARVGDVAAWSYYALLALGALSFPLTWVVWRWGRPLTWLAFAILSLWLMRGVPFFAVVAGPVLVLNLQTAL